MDKYQEFDSRIFQVTKIQVGFSLSEGQKAELREIAADMERARKDGSLDGGSYHKLLDTIADCGLELRRPETKTAHRRSRSNDRNR